MLLIHMEGKNKKEGQNETKEAIKKNHKVV